MEILPLFIYKEGVVGVGEIGFDDQTCRRKILPPATGTGKRSKSSCTDSYASP